MKKKGKAINKVKQQRLRLRAFDTYLLRDQKLIKQDFN